MVVTRLCVCKCEGERGLEAKSHKTEQDGSVLGVLCKTAVEGDGGKCWCGVDKVAVAVQSCVQQCEAGEGVGAKNLKLSCCGLVLGCIWAAKDGGGFCGVTEPSSIVT